MSDGNNVTTEHSLGSDKYKDVEYYVLYGYGLEQTARLLNITRQEVETILTVLGYEIKEEYRG